MVARNQNKLLSKFKKNEFIVYPVHGVGNIIDVERREIAGATIEFYVIYFEKNKLRLSVPTSRWKMAGMRKLADKDTMDRALKSLSGRARIRRTMWSKRAQEYETKINSGSLVALAEVVRDLYRSDSQPEQSYSERQIYENALERMAREIAAIRETDQTTAIDEIRQALDKGPGRQGADTHGQ